MAPLRFLTVAIGSLVLVSCGTGVAYRYEFVPGKSAIIRDGAALLPDSAPEAVKRAVAAGNQLQSKPYVYGGGHRRFDDVGYDCSGATSFVLHHAGLLTATKASDEFRHYGSSGVGDWITVYAARGHVFLSIAGLRLDTGYHSGADGPRWSTNPRPARGYVLRHPPGL